MNRTSELLNRITVNPDICHGKPSIRNKRYPVEIILSHLAAGDLPKDLIIEFPDLEQDDIFACLAYAAEVSKVKSTHLTI